MKASICMATYNRPEMLRRTLESIYRQWVPFDFETVVVDDGSVEAAPVCAEYPVRWIRTHEPEKRHSSSLCRNTAYRQARGEVIIAQSDEVIHHTPDAIRRLVDDLQMGTFLIATVFNVDPDGRPIPTRLNPEGTYASPRNQRPYFFLGSLRREDLYAIGGNDEDFVYSVCEDKWFADCLMNGLGLRPVYTDAIVGHHQSHGPTANQRKIRLSQALYNWKLRRARQAGHWIARGGAWA